MGQLIKETLQQALKNAIEALKHKCIIPASTDVEVFIEHTKNKSHGDYATNVAMQLAKITGLTPRQLAQAIKSEISITAPIQSIEIAGPGFINFVLNYVVLFDVVPTILSQKNAYGLSKKHQGKKINIEFISANPTGPLHVGHGRSAAYGAAISDLLTAIGYEVDREYYVNDAGRQMDILAVSIWLRYLELFNTNFSFPTNAYKGNYIIDIARHLKQSFNDTFFHTTEKVFENVPPDENQSEVGDKEAHIDALISNAKTLLKENYSKVFNIGLTDVLEDIKDDCKAFGINYQNWFSEKSLETSGALKRALEQLEKNNFLYKKDNALWFTSTKFGDDKDRVVVRENGQSTYFASDLAYLLNKIDRGYDKVIYIVGSDHHGYVPRLCAAAKAFNLDETKLITRLVQFAILYRGKEKIQMSTRQGEFVTLRALREEVGKDACRFFYVMRKVEQHMDFDLELAKSNAKDNPVYYIQYAHARICRVLDKIVEMKIEFNETQGLTSLALLTNEFEKTLLNELTKFPDILIKAAEQYEPHLLANFLKDLATALHSYYDASGEKILTENTDLRNARICLIKATQQVLQNGLGLLNLSAPEKM